MKKNNKFNRYTALIIITIILFFIIIIRLSYLQIIKAEENKELANSNSIRQISELAPRGEIIDKNGIVLATNKQSHMLIYMETEESKKEFFNTFNEVFKLIESSYKTDENGKEELEQVKDEFDLKVNPFRFELKNTTELRFKKDRGFHGKIIRDFFEGKAENDLTEEEQAKVDEELLKITPEEVFYQLVIDYQLYKLLNLTSEEETRLLKEKSPAEITKMIEERYTLDTIRKYMLVKDSIKMQSFTGYKPVTIASNIDRKTAFLFEQIKHNLPGIDVTMEPIRYYPFNELGSSFLGYISKINSEKKETYEQRGYDINTDYIGTAGLESAFEDRLRGSKGGTTVRVNKYGRKTEELFRLDPYPGQNMVLTIDKNLQAATERALNDTMKDLQKNNIRGHGLDRLNTGNATRGAAVVIDVNTGGVLAMASNPGYDPNLFAVPGRLTPELYSQYFSPDLKAFGEDFINRMGLDKSKVTVDTLFPIDTSIKDAEVRRDEYDIYPKPFYNYATSSRIPPGSTFKPLTAIAGLEEGVITGDEKIYDAAEFDEHGADTQNYTGACWIWNEQRGSHGAINVKQALEVSCNYFFYEVGYRLYKKSGFNGIADYAWKLGLGVDPNSKAKPSTGIEISENYGQVYNDTSRRNQALRFYRFGLVEMINRGKYYLSNGAVYNYTPLLIADDSKDNKVLSEGKKKFKEQLDKEVVSHVDNDHNYSTFKRSTLPTLVNELLNSYPEELRNSYTKQDITYNIEVIADYIYFTVKKEIETPGNVYDSSIGQGMNEFTPVQLANYIATVVNGGNRYKVHLVDKFVDAEGNTIEEFKPEVIEKVDLKPSTVDIVKEGMKKVTETGTASTNLAGLPISNGGKTGSATFKENQAEIGRTSYGFFVGFAPFDNPEIAVAIVIFDGGHGGYVDPVARAIYESYFREELKNYPNFVPKFDYTLNP